MADPNTDATSQILALLLAAQEAQSAQGRSSSGGNLASALSGSGTPDASKLSDDTIRQLLALQNPGSAFGGDSVVAKANPEIANQAFAKQADYIRAHPESLANIMIGQTPGQGEWINQQYGQAGTWQPGAPTGGISLGQLVSLLGQLGLGRSSAPTTPTTAGPLTGTPAAETTPQPAATPVPAAMPFQRPVSQQAPTAPNFSSQLQSGTLTPQQVVAAGGGSAGLTASNNDTASLLALLQARKIAQSGVTLPPAPASGTAAASPSIGAMPASSSASPAAPTQSTFGNPLASAYRTYSPASSTFSLNSLQPNDLSSLGTGAYGGTGLSSATVGDIGAGVGGTSSIGSLPAAPAYDASMGNIGNSSAYGGGGGATVGSSMGGMTPQMGSAIAAGIAGVGSGISKMFSPVQVGIPTLPTPIKPPVFGFTPVQTQA